YIVGFTLALLNIRYKRVERPEVMISFETNPDDEHEPFWIRNHSGTHDAQEVWLSKISNGVRTGTFGPPFELARGDNRAVWPVIPGAVTLNGRPNLNTFVMEGRLAALWEFAASFRQQYAALFDVWFWIGDRTIEQAHERAFKRFSES